jgi:hypothetical protein
VEFDVNISTKSGPVNWMIWRVNLGKSDCTVAASLHFQLLLAIEFKRLRAQRFSMGIDVINETLNRRQTMILAERPDEIIKERFAFVAITVLYCSSSGNDLSVLHLRLGKSIDSNWNSIADIASNTEHFHVCISRGPADSSSPSWRMVGIVPSQFESIAR